MQDSYQYTRDQLIELLGVSHVTFQKNEKRELKKLEPYEKIGRGKQAIYIFPQILKKVEKVWFQECFGFTSARPKTMYKYIHFLHQNLSYGFTATDKEVATQMGQHRPEVSLVRKELENHKLLAPLDTELLVYFTRDLHEEEWKERSGKKEWATYWRIYFQTLHLAEQKKIKMENWHGMATDNIGFFCHSTAAAECGYHVRRVRSREAFYFDLLYAIDKFMGDPSYYYET